MSDEIIETDFFVVGTGATAMAFVDTLLSETEAHVVMVDRRHRPGGHWNDAYSFVKLHGPSDIYGVASQKLERPVKETVDCTRGDDERASQAEIMDYYDDVMKQRFIGSGRVRWLPMTEYRSTTDGVHTVEALMTGATHRFRARRKFVNATHARIQVPATHTPSFTVASDVRCVPINDLPNTSRPHPCYTLIGSGKTSMDACLWLLQHGVEPDAIRWIRPRDHWMLRRPMFSAENFQASADAILKQLEIMGDAVSVPDLFRRLEDGQHLIRLDPSVEPTTYRCATVSPKEVEELRRVTDVVRLGHVISIERDHIAFDRGRIEADPDTLYIDCSAAGVHPQPEMPVFDGDVINLLWVLWCRPAFSAALVAFVESHVADERDKNVLCRPVKNPEVPLDWVTMWVESFANMGRWQENQAVAAWIAGCRLDFGHVLMRDQDPNGPAVRHMATRLGELTSRAARHLPSLLN